MKDVTDETSIVAQNVDTNTADDYAHGTRLIALTGSLMLGLFLVVLDNVSLYGLWSSY
jgi:hypothetical protein